MPETKSMPSAQFRLEYARLTEPVIVTVLGRPIGEYRPVAAAIDQRAAAGERPGEPVVPAPAKARRSTGSILERANKAGRS